MTNRWMIAPLFLILAFGWAATATAQPFVGMVKTLEGGAIVIRQGESIEVTKGLELMQGDLIKTDPKGSTGLIFSDDTLMSLGPNSEIAIDRYRFIPIEKKLSLIARILAGTVSFVSGQIAKLSPESVQLVVPAATIGVRGTHVLIKVN